MQQFVAVEKAVLEEIELMKRELRREPVQRVDGNDGGEMEEEVEDEVAEDENENGDMMEEDVIKNKVEEDAYGDREEEAVAEHKYETEEGEMKAEEK